jgi:hypothetical protein
MTIVVTKRQQEGYFRAGFALLAVDTFPALNRCPCDCDATSVSFR